MTDMTVSKAILEQLGGQRFIVMTGAKSFVGDEDRLKFRLPSTMVRGRGNHIEIILNAADLYDIKLAKIRNLESKIIDTRENVFAADLQKAFTEMTGLDTRMGSIKIAHRN